MNYAGGCRRCRARHRAGPGGHAGAWKSPDLPSPLPQWRYDGTLGVLDRPGRHVHGCGGPAARRKTGHRQTALAPPGRGRGRRRGRHPDDAGPGARRTGTRRADRRRQDGHHRGDQRPAGAHGRADRAGDHRGLPGRAAHRLPEPAADLRPPHRAARCAVRAGDRGPGAGGRAGRGGTAAGDGRGTGGAGPGVRRRAAERGGGAPARLPPRGPREGGGRPRQGGGLHAGQLLPRGQPADEAGAARRHHGGGRLSVADPRPVRGRYRAPTPGRAADVHAVQRRAAGGGALPRQGRGALRPRGRRGRHGPLLRRGGRRLRPGDRLRHGRHLHRRVALRGLLRADLRQRGRGRTDAGAHDEHPHRRGGRRLRPALRRAALPGRPRLRRCGAGARLLPPRRPADRHGRQRDARPRPAGALPRGVRPGRRPAAGRRDGTGAFRPAGRGGGRGHRRPARPRGGRRRVPGHRRAEHGQRGQEDLRAAWLRRHALRPHQLRRCGRPARVRGRRRAGHRHGRRTAAGRGAVRVRHRGRRRDGHARAGRRSGDRPGVGRHGRRRGARRVRPARRADAPRPARRRRAGGEHHHPGPRHAALRGHGLRPGRGAGHAAGDGRRVRRGAPRALRLHHGQAADRRGGLGRGGRRAGRHGRARDADGGAGRGAGAGRARTDVRAGAPAGHRAVRPRRPASR
ncbi:hypothetical protein SRIMM317S_00910 [Streptomyces rimosus subsp. rimosus]